MAPASDILRQMDARIRSWEAAGDGHAVFLKCYRVMTLNMMADLDDAIRDPLWVDGLPNRFAEYYFEVLHHYEAGDTNMPHIWTVAH